VILVDTSVWIDHLRRGDAVLVERLNAGLVFTHPFVIGELALGVLHQRRVVLDLLQGLPQATVASDDEVLAFIERHALAGLGVGYIDAHLLAAARLTPNASLWTRDKRLALAAERLGLASG
jgi:predicted nucleic acid-binding protein